MEFVHLLEPWHGHACLTLLSTEKALEGLQVTWANLSPFRGHGTVVDVTDGGDAVFHG